MPSQDLPTDSAGETWDSSVEFSQLKRFQKKVLTLGLPGVVFLSTALFAVYFQFSGWSFALVVPVGVSALGFISLMYVSASKEVDLNRTFRTRHLEQLALGDLNRTVQAIVQEARDGLLELPKLWGENQTRISTYHAIAKNQAETSFRRAQSMAIAGLVLITVLGVAAGLAPNSTGAIAAATVGVAGAATSGYIGATFMKMHAQATAQLGCFSQQPFEEARLLSAERVIASLEGDDRAAAVNIVLEGMMNNYRATPAD